VSNVNVSECLDGGGGGRRNVQSHKAIQESLNKSVITRIIINFFKFIKDRWNGI
jgi:hypothetical protein